MGMDDLETRELRYFVAVAEDLHFGRAALRLRIAQPALSKTVQRLETRLGVQLLTRSSRSVSLTSAGLALLQHGRIALSAVASAIENTRRAADGEHLRLVIKPGGDANLLSGILAAYAEVPGARSVDILFSGSHDRSTYLHTHRADVALLFAPFDDLTGLYVRTLHEEDRVAVLPAEHPLANRDRVLTQQLAHEIYAQWRDLDEHTGGPVVSDIAELIPLVRLGRAITVLPRSLIATAPPGVVLVPVSDAEPSRIVIGRRDDDVRPAVHDLIAAASRAQERR
jgi:DNA-binding transcriptional LysR family regulator